MMKKKLSEGNREQNKKHNDATLKIPVAPTFQILPTLLKKGYSSTKRDLKRLKGYSMNDKKVLRHLGLNKIMGK